MTGFYYLLSLLLVVLSLYHFVVAESHFRRLLSLNIMGSGVFLFLIATAKNAPGERVDPVLHALVLTGIVVAVSATAVGVYLLIKLGERR